MAEKGMAWKSCDPRPSKHARKDRLPRGESQGLSAKGKERAKDDDEVSLDYSGSEYGGAVYEDEDMQEINPLLDEDADPATMEFDVDSKVAECAGPGLSFRQVQSTIERTEINNSP